MLTLLTDFGLKDPYVAEMKAVILNKCPTARIVDISHKIPKFDIHMGAFVLASAASFFPRGTVHLAVVDPGVGTKRRPIILETKHSFFVGPDNGMLMLAALKEGLQHAYVIENPQFMLPKVSRTFHGRDIFAPAAAYLAKGCAASGFGKEIKDYEMPDFTKPSCERNMVNGEVLHIDDFGNIITNISLKALKELAIHKGDFLKVKISEATTTSRYCEAYGDVSLGETLVILGSHNFLEISVNEGSAAMRFNAKRGDSVNIQLQEDG
ncbi:MAG: SAM-dependent chlorinase/fluorinase [Candidatus Bathyarchaeota archaeon]|nr:MAG: SAM-dependent chlorinase/fluorinase [Candidatus Bathyarchaeota archaeon]